VQIGSRVVNDHLVMELEGELDLNNAPELREALNSAIDAQPQHLVVDLNQVAFLDSTTLGVLVSAFQRMRNAGGELSLCCPHERMLRLFRMTALDRVFTIHPTLEDATR
jgi:anti-sigma B factor antagonist